MRFLLAWATTILMVPAIGRAAPVGDPTALLSALAGNDTEALSMSLRTLLVSFLPNPLYEDQKHWGGQKLAVDGIKWRGKGLHVYPEKQYALKNDGLWWRVWLRVPRPAEAVQVKVAELLQPEPGRMTFVIHLWVDTDAEYERQRWNEGLRVWSSSIRARLRVKLALRCEAVTRFENTGNLLPDTIFRLRVVSADLSYDHVVVEHLAGLGGEAARVLGEAIRGTLHQLRPSLERKMLAQASAAIVKAGDTREVRLSLNSLFGKKSK